MFEMKETIIPEIKEQPEAAMELEQLQHPEVVTEQNEMDALQQMEASEVESLEQQEMDAFSESGKLGRMYEPDASPSRRYAKMGEYRIFCDTRPGGSRYDTFADGK